MSTSFPTITIAPLAKPRKRARTLSRMALALAALATAGLFNAAHATFPGENGVIVFDSSSTTGPEVIKKVSPGNSAVTDLGTGRYPSVSPNGRKIAFLKGTDVYVMDIDGSNIIRLTTLPTGQTAYSPAWLPDGSKVVYGRFVGSNMSIQLWSIKPDGTGSTPWRSLDVDKSTMGGLDLAWSPSNNIYTFNSGGFLSVSSDLAPQIIKLAADGSGSSWGPDGEAILFHNNIGQQFQVFSDGSGRRSVPSTGYISETGAISPDGEYIAGSISTNLQPLLTTRARAGTPNTFSWATDAYKTDWSRVPKNCYTSTPQGGGGVLAGDVNFYASQCAIVVMPDNGLKGGALQQALAVGPDGRLYHRTLQRGTATWTQFTRVPGLAGNPNGVNAKKIAIAASKDGSAQVVIINAADNLVYHAMRQANGSWSGFAALDGAGGAANFAARDVAIAINGSSPASPGNAQVIANGLARGGVFHRVRWAAGNWSPFAQIPPSYTDDSHELAITAGEDGYTDIVASFQYLDPGNIEHITRNPDSSWSSWGSVYKPYGTPISASSDVALTRTPSGAVQLVFTDSQGNALFQERTRGTDWSFEIPTKTIANTSRVVSISAGPSAGSSTQILLTNTFPQ